LGSTEWPRRRLQVISFPLCPVHVSSFLLPSFFHSFLLLPFFICSSLLVLFYSLLLFSFLYRYLIEECDANVDTATDEGTTAFCWAAWQGHLKVLSYLHDDCHCDVHARNRFKCNAALWAVQGTASIACLDLLSSYGSRFDAINSNGHGAFHKAAQRNKLRVVQWLVSNAATLHLVSTSSSSSSKQVELTTASLGKEEQKKIQKQQLDAKLFQLDVEKQRPSDLVIIPSAAAVDCEKNSSRRDAEQLSELLKELEQLACEGES
jgi:hypothetical protein